MAQIQTAIANLFKKHRIVFWYDNKKELRNEFESLDLPGIEILELANNEFSIKHLILREKPDQKFLIYHDGPPPEDLDNWLLDVQLAYGEFRADQTSLWLTDLGLGFEFIDIVQFHTAFFSAEARRNQLKLLLNKEDTASSIRIKMLAICSNTEPRMEEILESLLGELSLGQTEKIKLIKRCDLDTFLWERLSRTFNYQSESPGIQDFAIELFKSCYFLGLGSTAKFNNDALVFMKRWKDSISHHQAFEKLSEENATVLKIQDDLEKQDFRKLIELDIFRLIDQKILSDLVKNVANRTISFEDVNSIIRQRRRGHWYKEFHHLYEAIDYATQFIKTLDESNLSISSFAEGLQRYSQSWHQIDLLYRKVIFHSHKSGHISLLEKVIDLVENLYSNNYLLKINNNWQPFVDSCSKWGCSSILLQSGFFEKFVSQSFLENKKKIFVIISDALRFEVATELLSMVRYEDRYEAELSPMLSMLPSYTQLGMAALLPNKSISFTDNESGNITVDGMSTMGTINRDKILKQFNNHSTAIRAVDLLSMNNEDRRELIRDNEVVYVYHNRIDATGDKKESEERVFDAVEETLEEIMIIIKKLTAANANNILVTSDHGFIYQNRPIDESDFSLTEVAGDQVFYRDRRFALGKGLVSQPGVKTFISDDVGLIGNMEIQIPKSINRLRLKGSGSRYVHGGASLQEIVLPVLQINKKRESDVSKVSVDILKSSSTLITSGQISVTFYQTEPVSEKVHLRKLRAGIYTTNGELISDSHEIIFDLDLENAREREFPVRFMLTRKSNQVNNQEVILRLDEQVGSTTHYQDYKSVRYMMRRSFTSDFDF